MGHLVLHLGGGQPGEDEVDGEEQAELAEDEDHQDGGQHLPVQDGHHLQLGGW